MSEAGTIRDRLAAAVASPQGEAPSASDFVAADRLLKVLQITVGVRSDVVIPDEPLELLDTLEGRVSLSLWQADRLSGNAAELHPGDLQTLLAVYRKHQGCAHG